MWELIGLTALVLGIVAVALVNGCRTAIRNQQAQLDYLTKKLANIKKPPIAIAKEGPLRPPPGPETKPSTVEELLKHKTTLAPSPEPPPG